MSGVLKNRFFKWTEFLLLFVGGIIASCIFAPFENVFLGYIALVLFFSYILSFEKIDRRVFWKAYWFSFSFFMVGFSWICNALLVDGDSFVGFVPVVLLVMGAFFGLFIAVPVYFMKWGKNRYARAILLVVGVVVFEWIRSWIFTGFPWNLFGSALAIDVRLIQGAQVVGVYGLSLVLLSGVLGLALIVEKGVKKEFDKWGGICVLIALVFLGGFSLKYKKIDEGDIKVRLVQADVSQTFKWNKELLYENFRKYIDLSKSKPLDGIKMIVWGETATPYMLDRDKKHLNEIREAIGKDGFLITGLIRAGLEMGEYVFYNSLFVIDDKGEIKDYYDKAHLVPFGEYLPFRKYLPDFMRPVANVVGNLKEGEKYKNIRVRGLPLMGGAICYESIFPNETVNKQEKPEVLVVLANDGWYGISKGPYQHLVASQLRAVEEGVSVIRSANTGISAVIYPNGEIKDSLGLAKSGIVDVKLPKVLSVKTVYGKFGNWVVFLMLVVLSAIVWGLNRKENK